MTGFFRGVATAMVTPFTDDGVDFASLRAMIAYQIDGGVDALVILGTTGEPATMSETEREETVRCAVSEAAGRVKIVVGAGSNDTKKAVRLAERAKELGADGVLAVTPYYNKCTQRGLLDYYRAVAEVGLPVIAYNVPSRTGVNLLPETAEALAEVPQMAGIKEASGNMVQVLDILRRVRGRLDVFSGEDLLNLPILCAGGAGVVSVVSNLVPETVKAMTMSAIERRLYTANKLADRLFPLAKACFCEVNPIPVKEGLNLLGFRAGKPRPPLTPLEPAHREELARVLSAFRKEVRA